MQSSFHNTINLTHEALECANAKASSQEEVVLQFFKDNRGMKFTPCEVHRALTGNGKLDARTLLTSVRRAISDLTRDGKIVKTTQKKLGAFGMANYTWMLVEEPVYRVGRNGQLEFNC